VGGRKLSTRVLQVLALDDSGTKIVSIDEFFNNFEAHLAFGCPQRKRLECLPGPAPKTPQSIDDDPLVAAPRLTHRYTSIFWALWGLIVSGEEEAMQRHMTDNIVLRAPWIDASLSGERKGRAAVAKYFREFFASFDRFPFPQGVAVRSTGISTASISPVMVTGRIEARVVQTGRIVKTPFVAFFYVEDNRINMIEIWHDIEHWSEAFSCQLGEAFGCATANLLDSTTSKPQPQPQPKPKPQPKLAPAPEPVPDPDPSKPQPEPEVDLEDPQVDPEQQDPGTEPEPEPKPQPKPVPKPTPKPSTKPAPKPQPKPQPKPKTGTKPQPKPKSEPKPQPKPKPNPEPEPDAQDPAEEQPLPDAEIDTSGGVDNSEDPQPVKKPQKPQPQPKQTPQPKQKPQPSGDEELPIEGSDLPQENLSGDVGPDGDGEAIGGDVEF
jgi:ketosteroid isomerase-like protein